MLYAMKPYNIGIMDTLGLDVLSFIERLSFLQRLKCTSIIKRASKCVLCREGFFYCVLYSEYPYKMVSRDLANVCVWFGRIHTIKLHVAIDATPTSCLGFWVRVSRST